MKTKERKEDDENKTQVIVIPQYHRLFDELFSIDKLHLRNFNRLLLEKAGDESSPEGVALMIVNAISEMPSSVRGLVLNKLSQIIRALIGTDDDELVSNIRLNVNRILVVGT